MTQEVAYRFIQVLNALEQNGEVDPIVDTFSEFCEIETPVIPQKLHGRAQARGFWAGYRMAFRDIRSTFRNIVIGDHSIALEWTASCINRSGKEFQYDGVSILDTAGPHITHFRTYFDSRAMQEQTSQAAAVN
jgi:ketosteroid isomerase-like protein